MKKIFLIVIILHLINLIIAEPPKCITTKNVYQGENSVVKKISDQLFKLNPNGSQSYTGKVDWWFLQQLKGDNGGAIYTDSKLKDHKIINELDTYYTKKRENDKEVPNPIIETFKQFDGGDYKRISYNEAYNHKETDVQVGAHSKGFFIWNDEGIHVIHSYPHIPDDNDFVFIETKTKNLAQHSVCISLKANQLDIIPKYLIYGDATISMINNISLVGHVNRLSKLKIVTELNKKLEDLKFVNNSDFTVNDLKDLSVLDKNFETIDTVINNNWDGKMLYLSKWSSIAKLVADKDFTSMKVGTDNSTNSNVHYNKIGSNFEDNGSYFIQTSNSKLHSDRREKIKPEFKKKTKYNLVWEFISDYQKYKKSSPNWISHTMTKVVQKINKDGSSNEISFPNPSIDLVYRFETPWVLAINQRSCQSDEDHSKLLYHKGIDGSGIFCFGDLNWQGKQESRGGGAYCTSELEYLVDYYYRHVGYIRIPVSGNNPTKYRYDVRPFSLIGVGIDFNKIIKDITSLVDTQRKPDIEIKYQNIDSDYVSFTPKVYIYGNLAKDRVPIDYKVSGQIQNKQNVDVKIFIDNYNRYESVFIPILLESTDPTNRDNLEYVTSESFSLSLLPSIKGKVLLCQFSHPDCDYEDSISEIIYDDLDINLKYNNFDKNVLGYLNPKSKDILNLNIKSIVSQSKFVDQINLINTIIQKLPNVQIMQPLKFVKTEKSEFQFKHTLFDPTINDDSFCKMYDPSTSNYYSNVIVYHNSCFDKIVYCMYSRFQILNLLGNTVENIELSIKKLVNDHLNQSILSFCYQAEKRKYVIEDNETNTIKQQRYRDYDDDDTGMND